jgi:hypothetical protein
MGRQLSVEILPGIAPEDVLFCPHILSAFSIVLLNACGRSTSIGSIFMRRLLEETSTAGLVWLSKS